LYAINAGNPNFDATELSPAVAARDEAKEPSATTNDLP